ncbi:MAG: hypothetical protein PHC88_09880 [Terrimicrobiaceae bacterium]|nr:hypothetical protein [Terrimicrobiaceae bacterium]
MSSDCIIFVHKSESWYLYYTVKQARYFNPTARIVLITDAPQKKLRPYAEIHDISEYWEGASVMEEIYEHNSPFTREYEIINFQRWFVVRDFLRRNKVDRAIYVDSDLLVCDDLFRDFDRMGEASLGIVGVQGPFTTFIPNADVISSFCDFITHLYRNEKASLTEQYREWQKVTTDVSVTDMHALHTFISRMGLKTLDLSVFHDESVYDTAVQDSDGLKLRNGAKDIQWIDGRPSVQRIDSSEMIRLKTIHCQGAAKGMILKLFTAKDFSYYRDKVAFKMDDLAKRLVPSHA